jgi:hypothetical protein
VAANHILGLTELNWASSDSLYAEPITTKYAGDIAYLTAAFIRQWMIHRFASAPLLSAAVLYPIPLRP